MFGDDFLVGTDKKQLEHFMTHPDTINYILTAFVEHRDDTLTETVVHPSASIQAFKSTHQEQLVKIREKYLNHYEHYFDKASTMERSTNHHSGDDFYHYFLNLGSLHLALDDYAAAARCFEIAMNYPLKNHASETDFYFELPALLTAVCLELSGQYEPALSLYQNAQTELWVSEDSRHDIKLSIKRCQEKLASNLPLRAPEYKSAEVNKLVHPHDTWDFSKISLYKRLGVAFDEDDLHSYDAFVRLCWQGFNPLENWRLYVDGTQQRDEREYGWLGWENREPGSITAMNNVFSFIKSYGDGVITEEHVREIHRIAMYGVSGLNGNTYSDNELVRGGKYRTTTIGIFVGAGYNASRKGIELLGKRLTQTALGARGTFLYRCWIEPGSEESIKQGVVTALEEYYHALELLKNKRENYLEVIALIVDCVQKIELQHPFRDGNGRTTTALLNILLLQNRLPPVILENPNYFDGFAPDELVAEVLKGMQNFFHVKQYGTYPQGKATAALIRESLIATRENKGLKEIVSHQFLQAAAIGNTVLLREYLDNGVDVSLSDPGGNSALHIAAFYGHLECVQLLVQSHPELIATKGQDNATPLYLAAHQGHTEVAQYLLRHKANSRSLSIYNMTAAEIAAQRGFSQLATLLRRAEEEAEPVQEFSQDVPVTTNLFFGLFSPIPGETINISFFKLIFTLIDLNEVLHPVQARQLLLNTLSEQISSLKCNNDYSSLKDAIDLYHLLKKMRLSGLMTQEKHQDLENKLMLQCLGTIMTWDHLFKTLHNLDSAEELIPNNDEIAALLMDPRNEAYIVAFLGGKGYVGDKCLGLKRRYPQHCKYILNVIIAHIDVLNMFELYAEFEQLFSAFEEPEQQERLLDAVITGDNPKILQFISTSFVLVDLLSRCSLVKQDELVNFVLKSTPLFDDCLRDVHDLVRMIDASILFKEPLYTRILADDDLLKRVLTGIVQTEKAIALFSDSSIRQNQLLLRMLKVYSLNELIQLFGDNGNRIIEKMVDADMLLIEILNNDEIVDKLGQDYLKTWFSRPKQMALINQEFLVSHATKRGRFEFFSSADEEGEESMSAVYSPG
jgi:hypothetical protein